jgi:hypothetical protein
MNASRKTFTVILVSALSACDSPVTRAIVPNSNAPTPVPIIDVPFKLTFETNYAGMLVTGTFAPRLWLRTELGNSVPIRSRASFVARHPEIATVDTSGTIIAQSSGRTWIVASLEPLALRDSLQVSVWCYYHDFVDILPAQKTLRVGETFVPTIVIRDACQPWRAVGNSAAWAASDASILHVDAATGRTTARSVGVAWLVASGGQPVYTFGRVNVEVIPAQ